MREQYFNHWWAQAPTPGGKVKGSPPEGGRATGPSREKIIAAFGGEGKKNTLFSCSSRNIGTFSTIIFILFFYNEFLQFLQFLHFYNEKKNIFFYFLKLKVVIF